MNTETTIKQLQDYRLLLDRLMMDVAQFNSDEPLFFLQNLEKELQGIWLENKKITPNLAPLTAMEPSATAYHEIEVLTEICLDKLQICRSFYTPYCLEAEKLTENLFRKLSNTNKPLFDPHTQQFFKNPKHALGSFQLTAFDATNGQLTTWKQIKPHLAHLYHLAGGKKNKHNALNSLLNPDNSEFLQAVDNGYLGLHDEIGQLAILRLKDLSSSENKTLKVGARTVLRNYLELEIKGAPLYLDWEALRVEIYKIVLFSLINPANKLIWLGTARAVNAMIEHHSGEAIYLNPDPKKLNWQLNKAWLLAAQELGFEFKLVEQHLPNMEEAILTNNPAKLLEALITEIRPNPFVSQYNGGDAPTSTSQETLLLLGSGCQASKNSDGSIRLFKPSHAMEEQLKSYHPGLKKSHSFNYFLASSPPPLAKRQDHFVPPGKEEEDPVHLFQTQVNRLMKDHEKSGSKSALGL